MRPVFKTHCAISFIFEQVNKRLIFIKIHWDSFLLRFINVNGHKIRRISGFDRTFAFALRRFFYLQIQMYAQQLARNNKNCANILIELNLPTKAAVTNYCLCFY